MTQTFGVLSAPYRHLRAVAYSIENTAQRKKALKKLLEEHRRERRDGYYGRWVVEYLIEDEWLTMKEIAERTRQSKHLTQSRILAGHLLWEELEAPSGLPNRKLYLWPIEGEQLTIDEIVARCPNIARATVKTRIECGDRTWARLQRPSGVRTAEQKKSCAAAWRQRRLMANADAERREWKKRQAEGHAKL